jgi:hypothetical protein
MRGRYPRISSFTLAAIHENFGGRARIGLVCQTTDGSRRTIGGRTIGYGLERVLL